MNFLDAPSIFTVLSLTFSGSSNVFSAVFSPVRRTASYSRSTPQSKEISIGSVFPSMLTSLIKISSSVTVVTEDTAGKDFHFTYYLPVYKEPYRLSICLISKMMISSRLYTKRKIFRQSLLLRNCCFPERCMILLYFPEQRSYSKRCSYFFRTF